MTSNDVSTEDRQGRSAPSRASARPAGRREPGAMRRGTRLRPPSRAFRRVLSFAVVPAGLVLATFAVAGPSYSVFSRATSNPANAWTAGTVLLQNNSSGTNAQTGSALFSATTLQPGDAGTKCVAVTSTGTTPTTVAAYVSSVSGGSLPQYLTFTVAIGTGSSGTNGDCTGFTQTSVVIPATHLSSMPTTFAAGPTGWAPTGTGSETRVFKISYTVDTTVPNTLQNTTASATFTWEADS